MYCDFLQSTNLFIWQSKRPLVQRWVTISINLLLGYNQSRVAAYQRSETVFLPLPSSSFSLLVCPPSPFHPTIHTLTLTAHALWPADLHVMMPLDSEAVDINQLQQIMRLTGTPPASLISRMPSHEVRHMPSVSPLPSQQLESGPSSSCPSAYTYIPVYRQTPLESMCENIS